MPRQNHVYWYNRSIEPISDIPFVGGHVALDFVNTAERRGHPEAGDSLRTPADLRLWGQRYGLVGRSARSPGDVQSELERALEARELLYRLFLARAHGRKRADPDLTRLAELAAEAYRAGRLEVDTDGSVRWRWDSSDLSSVRHVAVTGALQLLSATLSSRLKQCPGDHCGWFFLDRTKRGNRRWCSMSECGQEAKDERRRERRQADRAPTPARTTT